MALSGTVPPPPPPVFLSGCPSTASVCVVVPSLTPGQEVFGSSVVSCPECYQESSSDGRPTLPLSAAGPCGARRKEEKMRTGGSVVKRRADKHHMSESEVQISLFSALK